MGFTRFRTEPSCFSYVWTGDVCYDADPENEEKSKVILPVARFSCIIAVVTFKEAVKSVTVPESFTKLV